MELPLRTHGGLNNGKEYFRSSKRTKAPIIIDGAGIHQIEEVSDAVSFL